MKSDNKKIAKLWKLMTSACQLILAGNREPDTLIDFLQRFVFGITISDIDWQTVYEALGMSAEYAEAIEKLGVKEDPNIWFVPVINGVTYDMVTRIIPFTGCSLDCDMIVNDRQPFDSGSYVVGFWRNIEADEANSNKSANALRAEKHNGITLLEYLLLSLGYFLTTGQDLDRESVTLCAGSRRLNGHVPTVTRGFVIDRCHPDYRDRSMRSRSAIL